jgi:hypothetical protein
MTEAARTSDSEQATGTLGPISDERVSEAASANSAAGSFGLSFGLAYSCSSTNPRRFGTRSSASILTPGRSPFRWFIPILAGLIGLFNSFRMMRLPDPTPSGSGEGMVIG